MEMIVGRRDTIAAIATPAGSGGIGIIRISGPRAIAAACAVLHREPGEFADRKLVPCVARARDGTRLDDVLAVFMRAPRSFTGEDIAEIHGHGGAMNMARLLRAVLGTGARLAEPGEFTRRAFENGKLDLMRAEAIVDVIEASSERAWRLAQSQLDGKLGTHVDGLRSRATALLAEVEACIDFPEQGEEYLDHLEIADKARTLASEIEQLAQTFSLGRALRDGIEVAIVGPVNAGKSSLFNALADMDRAIVDADPGTTRDFVEVSTVWDGIAVTLIDTAGARQAGSRIERQGIARGRKRAADADLCVCVHGADQELPDAHLTPAARELHVITKGDLLPETTAGTLRITSALEGTGIEELRRDIIEKLCGVQTDSSDGFVVTSERHRRRLDQATSALRQAASGVVARQPTEVLALDIREAAQSLAEMLGEAVGEDVLDELFRRFCIGK